MAEVKMLVVLFYIFIGGGGALPVEKRQVDYSPAPAAQTYPPPVDYNPAPQYPAGDTSPQYSDPAGMDPYAAMTPVYVPQDLYYQMPQGYPGLGSYLPPQGMPYQATALNPYGQPLDSYSVPPQYPPGLDPYAQYLVVPSVDPYQSLMAQYTGTPTMDQYAALLQAMYQQPYPAAGALSYSPPQNYPVTPSYQPSPPPVVVEQDTYLAVTSHDHGHRKHCGILPATNDALYNSDPLPGGVNDVVPYGQFPWMVLVVDKDDYTVACLGTQIHSGLVVTTASCITKPASKYTVIRDWDILTLYNEYEPYSSYEEPVCTYYPLGIDNSTGVSEYTLGSPYSDLVLLVGALEEHGDQYPADKLLCLPSGSSSGSPSYSYQAPPPYQNAYQAPPTYPSSYPGAPLPAPYQGPQLPYQGPQLPYPQPYPQISYASPMQNAECWVAGYLNSPNAILQNHPPSTPVAPTNAQSQYPQPSQQQYYGTLDNSKVPRRALVKQVPCPGNYPYPGYDDVCFVGIAGYDACVADRGTAVVCVINDDTNYQSGFSDDPTRDSNTPYGGVPSQSYQPQQQTPYQKPFQLLPAPPKQMRRRAVLYGVVKSTATCMAPSPSSYQQQSNPIVASRISPSIKSAIQDLFWIGAYDSSCPTEGPGDVLPDSSSGSGVFGSPPLPYSITSSLQPQQYDPSLSMSPLYAAPPPQQPYPQVTYTG